MGLTALLEKNYQKQVISTSLLYPEFSTYQNIGFCGQALAMQLLVCCSLTATDTITKTDMADFMKHIDGNRKLTLLDLPGSHDSGSFDIKGALKEWYRCQKVNYTSQFCWGVRVLDLRIGMDIDNDAALGVNYMWINHEGRKAHTLDNPAVATCNFLKQHPTETIIWLCKEEFSFCEVKGKYSPAFKTYTEKACEKVGVPKDIFMYLGSIKKLSELTLGDCRGKVIVITRKYDKDNVGWIEGAPQLRWHDDTTWEINIGNGTILGIQDEYGSYGLPMGKWGETKLNAMKNNRIAFGSNDSKKILINFVSASYRNLPISVCRRIEHKLLRDKSMLKAQHYGWTLLDFVCGKAVKKDKNIRDYIVNCNQEDNRDKSEEVSPLGK